MAHFLFITTKKTWGGSEPLWCDAAEKACQDGHEVVCVLPETKQLHARHKELIARGVQIVMRPPRRAPTITNRLRWKITGNKTPESNWWRRRFPTKFDAICISQGGADCVLRMPGLADWLASQLGKYILICQSTRVSLSENIKFREALQSCYSYAAKVGFTSLGNMREMEAYLAASIPNAYVHQNPMDFSTDMAVDWPSSETPLLSCPGRLFIQDKGQDILLQTLSLPPWKERRFKLQLFGEGPDKAYLQKFAEFLGLNHKVEFCGQTKGMLPLWQKTHLMILPSRSEGVPLVLVGAMAAGRPSVVTDVGGNAEWVRDGIDGFVARMPNVWSMNEALERAWVALGSWRSMAEQARQRFLQMHSEDPASDLLKEMLLISDSLTQ